jgi:hypothetical protein
MNASRMPRGKAVCIPKLSSHLHAATALTFGNGIRDCDEYGCGSSTIYVQTVVRSNNVQAAVWSNNVQAVVLLTATYLTD